MCPTVPSSVRRPFGEDDPRPPRASAAFVSPGTPCKDRESSAWTPQRSLAAVPCQPPPRTPARVRHRRAGRYFYSATRALPPDTRLVHCCRLHRQRERAFIRFASHWRRARARLRGSACQARPVAEGPTGGPVCTQKGGIYSRDALGSHFRPSPGVTDDRIPFLYNSLRASSSAREPHGERLVDRYRPETISCGAQPWA